MTVPPGPNPASHVRARFEWRNHASDTKVTLISQDLSGRREDLQKNLQRLFVILVSSFLIVICGESERRASRFLSASLFRLALRQLY